jgi:hypothetical protein
MMLSVLTRIRTFKSDWILPTECDYVTHYWRGCRTPVLVHYQNRKQRRALPPGIHFARGQPRLIAPQRSHPMKQIAIMPRPGYEVGRELHTAILCLRNAGIHARNAVTGRMCAIIWVDDQKTVTAVDALRNSGFEATELVETGSEI